MVWPPVKAWTRKSYLNGQIHFVAINYGGELQGRWVVLMSVLDSTVVVKVPWSQLVDLSDWEPGWDRRNYSESFKLVDNKSEVKTTDFHYPSVDSGLTIPISKNNIRPWFEMV